MGFRFYKSFKILPGVRLNISKSGISAGLGVPGANMNIGRRGRRYTAGLPGTGLSYVRTAARKRSRDQDANSDQVRGSRRASSASAWMPIIAIGALLILAFAFL